MVSIAATRRSGGRFALNGCSERLPDGGIRESFHDNGAAKLWSGGSDVRLGRVVETRPQYRRIRDGAECDMWPVPKSAEPTFTRVGIMLRRRVAFLGLTASHACVDVLQRALRVLNLIQRRTGLGFLGASVGPWETRQGARVGSTSSQTPEPLRDVRASAPSRSLRTLSSALRNTRATKCSKTCCALPAMPLFNKATDRLRFINFAECWLDGVQHVSSVSGKTVSGIVASARTSSGSSVACS